MMVPGEYREGHVELDMPVDWTEGARVTVMPVDNGIGLSEGTWPDTAEGRKSLLQKVDAIEPLELTPDEEREFTEFNRAVREASLNSVRRRMESSE